MQQLDFKMFVAVWNKTQRLSTPTVHFKIADWLEICWEGGRLRLLLQAFRSCGKSTIVGLFAAWMIYKKPDIRILVMAADASLAKKMVRNVKRIIERHPFTVNLKPERAEQWATERFTVKRHLELRDPTMMARGITSNITGSRADVIICDDVEVPKTCDTAGKRSDLRERLDELTYILVPGGTLLYVGTPHSWFTIYAEKPRLEIGEEHPFLKDFDRLKVPIIDPDGVSAWPERYNNEEIERIRIQAGPNKFKSQMMLQPVNIAQGALDPANLTYYDDELAKSPELKGLYLGGRRLVSVSAWWDPAFGKAGGDASVLAIVYTDEEGQYWLHHISYITADPDHDLDEATQQCRYVAMLAKRFYLPSICIEINGIGRFLPNILRREIAASHAPCAVQEISNTRPKDLRIMESFDAVMAARALYVHKSVQQTPFLTEMQEWKPNVNSGHDDGLDAVAGALSMEPIRLKRFYASGRPSWMGQGSAHHADTDFDI